MLHFSMFPGLDRFVAEIFSRKFESIFYRSNFTVHWYSVLIFRCLMSRLWVKVNRRKSVNGHHVHNIWMGWHSLRSPMHISLIQWWNSHDKIKQCIYLSASIFDVALVDCGMHLHECDHFISTQKAQYNLVTGLDKSTVMFNATPKVCRYRITG